MHRKQKSAQKKFTSRERSIWVSNSHGDRPLDLPLDLCPPGMGPPAQGPFFFHRSPVATQSWWRSTESFIQPLVWNWTKKKFSFYCNNKLSTDKRSQWVRTGVKGAGSGLRFRNSTVELKRSGNIFRRNKQHVGEEVMWPDFDFFQWTVRAAASRHLAENLKSTVAAQCLAKGQNGWGVMGLTLTQHSSELETPAERGRNELKINHRYIFYHSQKLFLSFSFIPVLLPPK